MSRFLRFLAVATFASTFAWTTDVAAQGYEPLPDTPPIPDDNPMSDAKVELGKKLYFDPRLSADGTISCQSCHNVMQAGTDARPTSAGVGAQRGGRNAPTVYNAAFLSVQFWDGRAATLEEQAKGPITNPIEMGMPTHDVAIERLRAIPGYVAEFGAVFGGEGDATVTIDNAAKAIAAYERTLVTPGAPFDRHLAGQEGAISQAARRGSELFTSIGCTSCHMGAAFAGPPLPVGTGFYQRFPTFEDNPYVAKYGFKEDTGRHEATGEEAHKHLWRVPTLRNVALTAPYFHNGSVDTLDEAVRVMAKVQLGRDLDDEQAADLVAFLESLTGEFPKQVMPRLPGTPGRTVVDRP